MFRGTYISGTGMLLQRRLMENVTHNITNADTVGYKKDQLVSRAFEDVLIQRYHDTGAYDVELGRRLGAGETSVDLTDPAVVGLGYVAYPHTPVGPLNWGTRVDQIYTDFTQGAPEQTELNTDLALAGEGFFVVQTEEGERYTRNGAFYLTPYGYLTDGEGHFLMGTEGPVQVVGDQFTVRLDGAVYVDDQQVNTLRIVNFEDPAVLRKQGDNLYDIQGGAAPIEGLPQNSTVRQGFVENSNVVVAREMVDMITVFRAYESNQRILTMTDEINGKAVNELGRLR